MRLLSASVVHPIIHRFSFVAPHTNRLPLISVESVCGEQKRFIWCSICVDWMEEWVTTLTLTRFSECVRWLPIFKLAEKCMASQTVICDWSTWSCIMYADCRRNNFKSLGRPFIVMWPLSKFVLQNGNETKGVNQTRGRRANQGVNCTKGNNFHSLPYLQRPLFVITRTR